MINYQRRSMRLEGYDYSQEGGYFITIVTDRRVPLFGEVVNGEMVLNENGKIVKEEWINTQTIRENVELFEDEFCIMPNHFHGIIWLMFHSDTDNTNENPVGRDTARRVPTVKFGKPVKKSLSTIVGAFKSAVTKHINLIRQTPGELVWQSRFYDHIIRSEKDYENIVNYIYLNPLNWEMDQENR